MIAVKELSKKVSLPDADYVFDKVDKLASLLETLTPKFYGRWKIIVVDPSIKYTLELLKANTVPEWVELLLYMNLAKIESVCMEHPELQPKRISRKEAFEASVAKTRNLIDKRAAKLLFQALGSNSDELDKTLQRLDSECTTGIISYSQVQSTLHYTKVVYASEVVNSFLAHEAQCWKLYQKLVHNIGMSYAYNACYAYVKSLLQDKQKFLVNEDVKNWHVKVFDAQLICYTYILFANSTGYNELPGIFYRVLNRSKEALYLED